MKNSMKLFAFILFASTLFWSCRATETVMTVKENAPNCYVQIGNEADLPNEVSSFLNPEEIEDFTAGPSYEWLPLDGVTLTPHGEWKRVVAYQAIAANSNSRLKASAFNNDAFMRQTDKETGEDKTILLEEDHGVFVFRDIINSDDQSLSRLVSSELSNDPMGYVKRKMISSTNDNDLTQTLLYGWIYTNNNISI